MRHLRIVMSHWPYGGNIIVKIADCGSDVEFEIVNIARTTQTIYLRHFAALRPL